MVMYDSLALKVTAQFALICVIVFNRTWFTLLNMDVVQVGEYSLEICYLREHSVCVKDGNNS